MKPSIRGNLIIFAKEYLTTTFSPYAVDRIIWHMHDEEDIDILSKPILETVWQPQKTFVNFLATAERVYGEGDYELCRKIGLYLAKESIPKFYKIFIRFGNPHFVIRNASKFWQQVNNCGRFEVTLTSPKSCTACLSDFAFPHKAFCFTLVGYCQSTLEISGARNVSFNKTKCVTEGSSVCETIYTWE